MNRLASIAMILAATAMAAAAAPKIALVRVKEIYSELSSTAALQERVKGERQEIQNDERANMLRSIIEELRAIDARLRDKSNPLDEVTARKLARTYEIKRQEAQTLQREFEDFRKEREKEINRRMVTAMRKSLDQIVSTSQRIAEERGFDTVLDSSGSTNTGVPFVLYNRDSPDLTDVVKSAIQDSAPGPKPDAAAATAETPKNLPNANTQ